MQIRLKYRSRGHEAFTLVEVLVCLVVMGLVFAGILTGNTQSSARAEWSGYSLAAQALAVQQVEEFRASYWDTQAQPPVDQTTNFPASTTNVLDLPIAGTNAVWVTNYTTVSQITLSTNPIVCIKMMTVNTVWLWRGKTLFTNTMVAYRAPDQ
jgi:prepilin-type N-terminal cleavage/methylation domain-containing protein